jgi:hypothetical protein
MEDKNLTGPEMSYFVVVLELANLTKLLLKEVLFAPSTREAREEMQLAFKRTVGFIERQTQDFLNVPDGFTAKMQTFHGVAALHAMGMLRETSLVTKNTVQYLVSALDRVKATDKTRSTKELAWLSPELKTLWAAAINADAEMKTRVKKLTDNLHTSGWVDRLDGWAFELDATYQCINLEEKAFRDKMATKLAEVIPQASREAWAIDVADSWRDVVKGWSGVKFD